MKTHAGLWALAVLCLLTSHVQADLVCSPTNTVDVYQCNVTDHASITGAIAWSANPPATVQAFSDPHFQFYCSGTTNDCPIMTTEPAAEANAEWWALYYCGFNNTNQPPAFDLSTRVVQETVTATFPEMPAVNNAPPYETTVVDCRSMNSAEYFQQQLREEQQQQLMNEIAILQMENVYYQIYVALGDSVCLLSWAFECGAYYDLTWY